MIIYTRHTEDNLDTLRDNNFEGDYSFSPRHRGTPVRYMYVDFGNQTFRKCDDTDRISLRISKGLVTETNLEDFHKIITEYFREQSLKALEDLNIL